MATASKIQANVTNEDLVLESNGTGSVIVDSVAITDNKISTYVSNANLEITTDGTGTIELQTSTNVTGNLGVTGEIQKTGDLIVNVSGDIVLDADGGDVYLRDGAAGNYGAFIRAGSNDLTIASGSTQAVIFTGANAAFQGDISTPAISIVDNEIKATRTNDDIQIETNGTGVLDLLTPTQATVGSAGSASALPGQPTGYIKIKIAGTMRVVPFYDQA